MSMTFHCKFPYFLFLRHPNVKIRAASENNSIIQL